MTDYYWYDKENLKQFKEYADKSHRHLIRTLGMRRKTSLEMALTFTSREELGLSPCEECDEANRWTIDI